MYVCLTMGLKEIRKLKEAAKEQPQKKPLQRKKPLRRVSPKKETQRNEKLDELEPWFQARRIEMTGMCQCGCCRPSSKNSDQYFRHSAAHVFPKAKFKSVRDHPENWVERAFWGGCHTNMDDRSIERWPDMRDWPEIKRKFYILAPLLTEREKGTKFYAKLAALVYLY